MKSSNDPKGLTRQCPMCPAILTYKSRSSFSRAEKDSATCVHCRFALQALKLDEIYAVIYMNGIGLSNRQIAGILNLNHKTISNFLSKVKAVGGPAKDNFANQPIDIVSDKEARCRRCGDVKSIDEFQWGRRGQKYQYKFSYCNKCRKKQTYLNLNKNVNKFLADRFNRLKRRAKEQDIPCTITKEEFILQYYKQDGLCFYTDVPLICEVGSELHRNSLSVDKLVPEEGYRTGNVVFATHRINTCKCDLPLTQINKYMPTWFERAWNFLGDDMMNETDYCKHIKLKELITINGCSATNYKTIDAELLLDDDGGKIIIIENPSDQLKVITKVTTLPHGVYTIDGTDIPFQAKATWLWTGEKGLSIQL